MGYFAAFTYDGAGWAPSGPGESPQADGPWMTLDIHDSDIATINYRPLGPGSGVAYLGFTPRTYFEREDASSPTDVAREASAIAVWWAAMRGGADAAELEAKVGELAGYLAEDLEPEEIEDGQEDEDEVEELDDAEVFVEVKVARFLAALDLPLPDGLPG